MPEPRNKESCNAVYLRSGKNTGPEEKETEIIEVEEVEEPVVEGDNEKEEGAKKPKQPPVKPVMPRVPFPSRLKEHKDQVNFLKFLEVFKKLTINIPFADALTQMPSYTKFMRDILSKKKPLDHQATVALNEECSAIFQNKLPQKLNDPGSFSIPIQIGKFNFNKVLCDLGASINLMPLSVFRNLGLGDVSPTAMTLKLADRSIRYPYGVVEDVLVKVGKFYFPVDFVVIDIDEDDDVPMILGRSFLATGRALIDMEEGEITFRVGGERVAFQLLRRGDDERKGKRESGDDRKCGRSNTADTKPS